MITLRHARWTGAGSTLGLVGLTLAGVSCDGSSMNMMNNPMDPPTLTGVMPGIGPTSGNIMLTLTGTNFASGTTVQIGNAMATGVNFSSATQLTAMLPPQQTAFGLVPVVVTRSDGMSAMRSDLFRYYAVSVDFGPGGNVAVGNTPASAVAGDFNGDGKLDVVVGNQGSNDLTMLLSQAAGPLKPQASIGTGGLGPSALAVGDLNGDGKLDLVFISNLGTDVNVMIGNGTGGFAAPVKYGAGTGTRGLVLADLNGDKNLDAVVVNNSKGVSALLGSGDGKFGTATSVTVGTAPSGVTAADFTGDGKIDLVISDVTSNNGALLPGTGDGKFAASLQIPLGGTATGVASGDFDGDGKQDVAFLGVNGLITTQGNGTGGFATAKTLMAGTGFYAIAAADLNGDGKTELISVDIAAYKTYVFVGDTAGLGQPKLFTTGMSPDAIAIGDFDGDKRPDIAVSNQGSNDVTVLYSQAK